MSVMTQIHDRFFKHVEKSARNKKAGYIALEYKTGSYY